MKNLSLIAAGSLIVTANGMALIHAARNRAGEPEASVVMTGNELTRRINGKDSSSVELRLTWRDALGDGVTGLDRKKLTELGFDCSVDPSSKDSELFYRRQRPRPAFAALEYEGAAWQSLEDSPRSIPPEEQHGNRSHLILIDAASNPRELRRRHPDRAIIILPARVSIVHFRRGDPARYPALSAYVDISNVIHVPRPFSAGFPASAERAYRVHLSVGALYEPWITGLEIVSR